MKSEVRKIGFDAQESITFLVEKLEIDHREGRFFKISSNNLILKGRHTTV